MKWNDYREKLGIGAKDKEKYEMLRNNVSEFLPILLDKKYLDSDYLRYALMTGEQRYAGPPITGIIYSIRETKSLESLIARYIALYNSFSPGDVSYDIESRTSLKNDLLMFLKSRLDELGIGYEIIADEDGLFVFPKGSPELDRVLVSAPLDWLVNYPKSRKQLINALKSYVDKDKSV